MSADASADAASRQLLWDDLPEELLAFRLKVLVEGKRRYRDLPWRNTRDPYAIWISEVMLQQTQVARVDGRWQRWLEQFPTVQALAAASTTDVLRAWQGMGYNRRALSLHEAAQRIAAMDAFPSGEKDLVSLPGIGPTTAAGIRAFAFNMSGVYLETNVRSVFLHELFPQQLDVGDKTLQPLVRQTCPPDDADPEDNPRSWYYALLDYGAYLKQTILNPSRRSRSYTKQSRFEGSHRQKRAAALRLLLQHPEGMSVTLLCNLMSAEEQAANRPAIDITQVETLLAELAREGFCHERGGIWLA